MRSPSLAGVCCANDGQDTAPREYLFPSSFATFSESMQVFKGNIYHFDNNGSKRATEIAGPSPCVSSWVLGLLVELELSRVVLGPPGKLMGCGGVGLAGGPV